MLKNCGKSIHALTLLLVVALTGLAAPAAGDEVSAPEASVETPEAPVETPKAPVEGLAYTVRLEGELEPDLAAQVEQISNLVDLRAKPPRTAAGLARRIARDEERLYELLRAHGFYDAKIDSRVDDSVAPVAVAIHIDTGVVYLLEAYDIRYVDTAAAATAGFPHAPEDVGLVLGMRAIAVEIRRASRAVVARLGEIGHPLAEIADERIVVDHARTTMRVALDVAAGRKAAFGALSVGGLDQVSGDYVRSLRTWREGELYDQRKVDAYRSRLAATGLFESIALDHEAAVGAAGDLPVALAVRERKHRSIGAGASVSTDIGFAVRAFWEHRNLLGANEQFRLTGRAGQVEQSATADFVKPNYRMFGQNLLLNGLLRRQQDDAFDEKIISVFAGLERDAFENWRVRAGPSFDYSILSDAEGERNVELVGFPMSATRDDTDDLLDATRGTRLALLLTPYFGAIEESVNFLTAEAHGEAFVSLDADDRIVLAGRSRIGSIVGEATATVPANKRFYSGGGGSVRGYPFRSLGPLDTEKDPLGGRSVLELGFETRLRVSEEIGIVPFIEGGSVFDEPLPDSVSDLRWAAGLGVRYYTAIGPLRLDVAVPLDRRREVDDSFEIYLSIGQAF